MLDLDKGTYRELKKFAADQEWEKNVINYLIHKSKKKYNVFRTVM